LGRQRSGGSRFEASLRKIVCETLSLKHSTQNRAGGLVQVVEHLPMESEALSSNPSTTKKKKKTERKETETKTRRKRKKETERHRKTEGGAL
jgi:hypothetical protein